MANLMSNEEYHNNPANLSDRQTTKQIWIKPALKILDISETAQPGGPGNDGMGGGQGMAGS